MAELTEAEAGGKSTAGVMKSEFTLNRRTLSPNGA